MSGQIVKEALARKSSGHGKVVKVERMYDIYTSSGAGRGGKAKYKLFQRTTHADGTIKQRLLGQGLYHKTKDGKSAQFSFPSNVWTAVESFDENTGKAVKKKAEKKAAE